jgi:ABC-type siderophore export system fused ATPase/permease subunit
MGNYKKRVSGENISADELASHNYISVFSDGSGKIVVCFLILLATAALAYLWITMHVLLVVVMVGSVIVLSVIGVSTAWRHVSHTRKEHLCNEAEIEWSRIVYTTENLIATRNRQTQEIHITNAQQIQEVHHHAPVQISEVAQSKSYMPKLSDLNRDNQV